MEAPLINIPPSTIDELSLLGVPPFVMLLYRPILEDGGFCGVVILLSLPAAVLDRPRDEVDLTFVTYEAAVDPPL